MCQIVIKNQLEMLIEIFAYFVQYNLVNKLNFSKKSFNLHCVKSYIKGEI